MRMSRRVVFAILSCLFLFSLPIGSLLAQDDQPDDPLPEPTQNYAFIFDASGSMRAGLAGRTRLAVAQDVMVQLSAELAPNVNASLWVYGHRLPQDDVAASCRDIEEVIPLSPVDVAEFERVVRNIQAIGYTPITDSLAQAAASLPIDGDNTIILISDGEETCAGDPCAMARELAARDANLLVNTIGFVVNEFTRQQLECIAEVTGGVYLDAPGPDELTDALREVTQPPGIVRIVDQDGAFLPDVPFSVDHTAGGRVGNFSGSATLPAGDYVVNVMTDPAMTQTVTVTPNETVSVPVQVVQLGVIALVNADGERINDQAYNVTSATGEFFGQRTGAFTLPAGDYDVEVRVRVGIERTDRALMERVTVRPDEVTEVLVDFPSGMIRIVDDAGEPITGFVTSIIRQDTGEFLYSNRNAEFVVLPGEYDVIIYDVFTPLNVSLTVEADGVSDIVIETRRGDIVPLDEDGQPTEATFQISDAETGALLHFDRRDVFAVPPGTYNISIREFGGYDTQVTVEAGGRVTVPVVMEGGIIQPVDGDDNPIAATLEIIDTTTETVLHYTLSDEFAVPPGTYTVTIRTQGFIASSTTEVTIASGETVQIPILEGFIVPVDADGNPIEATLQITDLSAGQDVHFERAAEFAVPPGTYDVTPYDGERYTVQIEIAADEIVEIEIR
ncbi:MAG: VWA domain-containing protein [Anaerolineaceae bacterium]|nr:MAG: VWA domain-containing protein [Anaerolineaceae bacterium]